MKKFYTTIGLVLLGVIISCSKSNDTPDEKEDPVAIPDPAAATLVFPANNTECNNGESVNDTESKVNFKWNTAENTDSYVLTLTNLSTSQSSTTAANTNEATITILKGTPYEWLVTSKANGTNATAQSSKFRLYNEGDGVVNYTPFPPQAVYPTRGSTLNSNISNITLEWAAEDVDGDIASYEVFFGLQDNSTTRGNSTTNSIEVSVTSGKMYEWYVIAKDSQNNTAISEIFLFKVAD